MSVKRNSSSNLYGGMKFNRMKQATSTNPVKSIVEATGGTEATYNLDGINYKTHTFTSSGNFVVLNGGFIDYLIVGGGGGGGNGIGGGGGGGGVYNTTNVSIATATYGVIVGPGGARQTTDLARGNNGSPSSFNGIIAGFGGSGGGFNNQGAGGGGGGTVNGYSGGAYGQRGTGAGGSVNPVYYAISGLSYAYSAGGGNGSNGTGTSGGVGAGNGGSGVNVPGTDATNYGAGGGGGSGNGGDGGAGKSGVVIIRYQI